MSEAFEQFALLLASIWGNKGQKTLVHRPAIRDVDGGVLLYAADPDGHRHVLAPIHDDYAFSPRSGAAIDLSDWRHPETGQRYLDLQCTVDGLAPVFYRLADSITERVGQRQERAHVALINALTDWQRLLEPAAALGEAALRGVFGELTVLLMLAKRNPAFAVDCWTGPEGMAHDFTTARGDIEVKTTHREGRDVEISSLRQLDEIAGVPLALVRVHVQASPRGKRIRDLVDDLVAVGCLRNAIAEKLALVGFQLGVTQDEYRFVVSEEPLAWIVGPDFPGLRSWDIPAERLAAITHIKYTLDLLGAPGEMTPDALSAHIDAMVTS
ncbi:PD-(D/E)XK motif protein [Kribbia dieselivorans]|uniref:PD-(D/E)XK motif protein n=1 Tax=Kribbia dieselivorans TaxID=331526 RepID=UPI0008383E31|nr:PD-(D/E)XK motif protein [Kribbia dieselivorans]